MQEDEPVEIELTPTDPDRSASGRLATPQSATASAGPTRIGRPGRQASGEFSPRMVVMIAAVGFLGLAIGWALGRATTGEPEEAATPGDEIVPTTAASSSTRSGPTALTEAVDPVATTTESPRPTTTFAPVESTVIDVDPRLADADYVLVGTDRDGGLVRLDPSDGELTTRRALGPTGQGGPSAIWAGEGWIVVPDWDTGSTVLIEDGEEPVRTPLGPPWQVFADEITGEFWTLDSNLQRGARGYAQRVDRYGEPIGGRVELGVIPLFTDPAGGLVVRGRGSSYQVDEAGRAKIADGRVLALNADRAVAWTCDDQLACEHVLVDRATGDSTLLPIDPDLVVSRPYWASLDATRIAPDGHTIGVTWLDPSSGPTLALVDLDTGELTSLTTGATDGLVRWSPDGRFAFYLDGGLLMAHDIAAGESFVVAEEFARLHSLAIQPTG